MAAAPVPLQKPELAHSLHIAAQFTLHGGWYPRGVRERFVAGGDNMAKCYNGPNNLRGAAMAPLTFRNSVGELVDIPDIPATRMKNEFGSA